MHPARRARPLRLLLGALIGVLLVGIGHGVLWRMLAGGLEDGFAGWAAARRAQGWQIEHGPPIRGGWPLAATLTLPRFQIAGGDTTLPDGLAWQAEAVHLRVALPRPDRLAVLMPGLHRLRLGPLTLPFTADRLEATLPLERGVVPKAAAVVADRLRVGTAAGGIEARRLEADLRLRRSATEAEPAFELSLVVTELLLPDAPTTAVRALGRMVQYFAGAATLSGPVPAASDPAGRAEAWRDGGGTLALRDLELRWGAAVVAASATLALDEALQPMGAGLLRVDGAAGVIDAAAAGGAIGPGPAAAARALLPLLLRPAESGGDPVLELALTLEEGLLAAGRIPVLRLPGWTWPAAPAPIE